MSGFYANWARMRDITAAIVAQVAIYAASAGASLIGFVQAGVGAVARTVQAKLRDSVNLADFLPVGYVTDGSVNYAAQIQAAIDYASANSGRLELPRGTFRHDATLIWKNNCVYSGSGKRSTTLLYTGVADGNQVNNPVNSSTAANIHFQDIGFTCNGGQFALKAAFADVGSTYITWERCLFYGQMNGLILDQTELGRVRDCEFILGSNPASIGIWIANGNIHSPGAVDGFTNQLLFEGNQFNGTVGIAVADDGGIDHTFLSNNFNHCDTHLRLSGVRGCQVIGGEMEGSNTTSIIYAATKVGGTPQWAFGDSLDISGVFWVTSAQLSVSIAAGSLKKLTFVGNTILGSSIAISGANNLDNVVSYNNSQLGAGTSNPFLNNYFENQNNAVGWAANTSPPSIGNGSLVSSWSRKGQDITVRGRLTFGTTTSAGAGFWTFTLPQAHSNTSGEANVGVGLVTLGTYTACVLRWDGGNSFVAYPSGSAALVGAGTPGVWAAGHSLDFTFTYVAANKLG